MPVSSRPPIECHFAGSLRLTLESRGRHEATMDIVAVVPVSKPMLA
jgi:hypothetical protein